jgi:hypothetical protein
VRRLLLALTLCSLGCVDASSFPAETVAFQPLPIVPALEPEPGRWDAAFKERGFVRHDDDGWWLWYTGRSDEQDGALGLAWSRDGLAFDRLSPAPIYQERHIEDVFVFADQGTYYMFAEGENDEAQWLSSPDRIHWTRQGAVDVRLADGTPVPPGPLGTPSVVVEGNTWYLLYERRDDGIWLAASTDHRTFINVQDDPVIALGPGSYDEVRVSLNQVVKYGGRYYAYYNAQGRGPEWTTAVASSTDLVHWDKYPGNPILSDIIVVLSPDEDGFRLYSMQPVVKIFESHARPGERAP